jgi:hypothetical protein
MFNLPTITHMITVSQFPWYVQGFLYIIVGILCICAAVIAVCIPLALLGLLWMSCWMLTKFLVRRIFLYQKIAFARITGKAMAIPRIPGSTRENSLDGSGLSVDLSGVGDAFGTLTAQTSHLLTGLLAAYPDWDSETTGKIVLGALPTKTFQMLEKQYHRELDMLKAAGKFPKITNRTVHFNRWLAIRISMILSEGIHRGVTQGGNNAIFPARAEDIRSA